MNCELLVTLFVEETAVEITTDDETSTALADEKAIVLPFANRLELITIDVELPISLSGVRTNDGIADDDETGTDLSKDTSGEL